MVTELEGGYLQGERTGEPRGRVGTNRAITEAMVCQVQRDTLPSSRTTDSPCEARRCGEPLCICGLIAAVILGVGIGYLSGKEAASFVRQGEDS